MSNEYDCIVVGVGGMGSAAVSHLAARGVDVLGIEQFDIPHTRGSSHGYSRIIRLAYFEDSRYIPLLRRSYELWERLDDQRSEDILFKTGSISAGLAESEMYSNAREACDEHDIDYELLTSETLQDRFPGYELPRDYRAIYQPDGGFVVPERAISAQVERAFGNHGTVRARERVEDWWTTADGVAVETGRRTYTADSLVVTAGAWTGKILDVLDNSVQPERQVLGWFQPTDRPAFAPDRFPVFTVEAEEGDFYGFPVYGVPGFKIGRHHHLGETVDPDETDKKPTPEDEQILREFVERCFPSGAGPTMRLETCMYVNSPDERFIIDAHPDHSNVFFAAGFSGHGFKFCPVVGEILADLAIDGETEHDIGLFRLDRL